MAEQHLGFCLDELCDAVFANQPYSFFEDEEHCRRILDKHFDKYPNSDDVSHEDTAKKFFEDCMDELCKIYAEELDWIVRYYVFTTNRKYGMAMLEKMLENPPTAEICEQAVQRGQLELGLYTGELVLCRCGCAVNKSLYPNASSKNWCDECLESLD